MKKIKLNIQMFASTNKTTNYDLPQFIGTDKPSWLGDVNGAMSAIDTAMHTNATTITGVQSTIQTLSASLDSTNQSVTSLSNSLDTLDGKVTTLENDNNINKAKIETNSTYSTDEIKVGTWIDGKPIYRKVYQFTTPSTENSWGTMGQTGVNIESVVDFRGTVFDTGLSKYNSINSGEGSYFIHTAVDAGNNRNITMIQKGWSSLPCIIIIEYTKTTD